MKLEVGCGTRLPGGYIGVDLVKPDFPSPKTFINGEAVALPFANSSIEEVSCSHTVEHLTPKYFIECLSEWSRVLSKDGRIVIRCPNANVYLRELIQFFDNGGWPRENDNFRGKPFDLWPIVNVTGLASMGNNMVNRNHFSLEHLVFYVKIYGGFKITKAEVVQSRQNHGVEYRSDGDLLVVGVKSD